MRKFVASLTLLLTVLAIPAFAEAGRKKKDPQVEAALDRLAATPVTCSSQRDCEGKWAKALLWVTQNSGFKIQLATDTLIQTYGPSGHIHGTAFIITKMPAEDGYTLEFQALCNSQPFCGESPRDYKASFVSNVMSLSHVSQ